MTKERARIPRAICLHSLETLREQLAIVNGLLLRAEAACQNRSFSGAEPRETYGDSVVENLAHMNTCLDSIGRVLRATLRMLQAEARNPSRRRSKRA